MTAVRRVAGGTALLAVYLAMALLVAGLVVLLWNPYLGLYGPVTTGLAVALALIGVRYLYFYGCILWHWHDFHPDRRLRPAEVLGRPWPFLKFQVTTKGGAIATVERSLDTLDDFCRRHPDKAGVISAEVVTEVEAEVERLRSRYSSAALEVTAIALPAGYRTPAGTRLKARALHYMVEMRRAGLNRKQGRAFVVHLDDETLIREQQLLVLAAYLTGDPAPVSEGPIFYPLDWQETPWLCRTIESMRPFGCSECAHVMQHPPPTHLHGSNLVVDEEVENRIGWDMGTLDGQPFIAEDLVFGLRCYAALGPSGFGWHGAAMLEQPPFSLYWAFRQRQRWVLGALQGCRALWRSDELKTMPLPQRLRINASILYRTATYALGFPVGMVGLLFLARDLLRLGQPGAGAAWVIPTNAWGALLLVIGLAWLLSYQIGLARNLRDQRQSPWERLGQHLAVLALTPVAGLAETVGPFTAVARWLLGLRAVTWTPTLKTAGPMEAAPDPPAPAPSASWTRAALGLLPLAVIALTYWARPALPQAIRQLPLALDRPPVAAAAPAATASPTRGGGPQPATAAPPDAGGGTVIPVPVAARAPTGSAPSPAAAGSSGQATPAVAATPTPVLPSPLPALPTPPAVTPTPSPSPLPSVSPPAPTPTPSGSAGHGLPTPPPVPTLESVGV